MADHVDDELASHLREHSDQISQPFFLSTTAQRVRSWSQPGVFLIGDAAHTHSPVGAQGVNIALRDSIVAANHLVPTLRAGGGGAELDAAARRIEAERIPEVRTIQRMQARPPKLILADGWWGERARGLLTLLRFPLAQAIATRAARPFAFGVTQVDLSV
jgi:2-polyprenyl-6-methoxyphenol hydroxylase-like FAD-dependent oxidoreductase